jgi:phosphoenolpyruvate carboxykinase (ATP)
VSAALSGELDAITFTPDPVFGVAVPQACPGVPAELLQPSSTWSSASDYERQARQLAQLFHKNFAEHAKQAGDEVRQAGPIV